MNIGILDCKVNGSYIEDVGRYRSEGFEVINAGALDKPKKNFDILAATWTLLSEKRLRNVGCRGVVVKDNDEPWNVIMNETVATLNLPPVKLIENWGISTRVAWNREQIRKFAPDAMRIALVADTPSHAALETALREEGFIVDPRLTPKNTAIVQMLASLKNADVIVLHLGKQDFSHYWFDRCLDQLVNTDLLISTTRGAVFSAKALNLAIAMSRLKCAVLDWAWQEDHLLKTDAIVLTNHTSYRSADSKRELTEVTIKAVKQLAACL